MMLIGISIFFAKWPGCVGTTPTARNGRLDVLKIAARAIAERILLVVDKPMLPCGCARKLPSSYEKSNRTFEVSLGEEGQRAIQRHVDLAVNL